MQNFFEIQTSETQKQTEIKEMFNSISSSYDILNHTLSFGIDILWRRKAIKILEKFSPKKILDIACGTCDFSIEAMKLNPEKIIGLDVAEKMLEIGKQKIEAKNFPKTIELQVCAAENLKFENESFDSVIVAFGVRNFSNLKKGLSEIYRVLKKNGVFLVLEFSKPKIFLFKQIYFFYFKHILPLIGKIISKNFDAYKYLPNTVLSFPDRKDFLNILNEIGFKEGKEFQLTFGIATIYLVKKS